MHFMSVIITYCSVLFFNLNVDGDVVDNPFEAQYLFADNEDASDVKKYERNFCMPPLDVLLHIL